MLHVQGQDCSHGITMNTPTQTGMPQRPLIHIVTTNNPLVVTLTVSTPASGTSPSDETFQFLARVTKINSTSMFETMFPWPRYQDGIMVELEVSSELFQDGGEFMFVVGAENQYGRSLYSSPIVVEVMGSESVLPGVCVCVDVWVCGCVYVWMCVCVCVCVCGCVKVHVANI